MDEDRLREIEAERRAIDKRLGELYGCKTDSIGDRPPSQKLTPADAAEIERLEARKAQLNQEEDALHPKWLCGTPPKR